jgi:hypothetical protein
VVFRVVLDAFENDFAAVDFGRVPAGYGCEFGVVLFDYFRDAAGGVVGDDLFDLRMPLEETRALRESDRM